MANARFIVADVFDGLARLPDKSVDLVLSSPPFLALRSYLPADHPDKPKEIGSEATPADFLDTLLDVVEAVTPKLCDHGSLVFELGDTFAGSGGAGGDYNSGGLRDGQERFNGSAAKARAHVEKPRWRTPDGTGRRQRGADEDAGILVPRSRPGPEGRDHMAGWPLDKSLTGIPTLFAWSLAYGRNLLRPERTTGPWRIRNVIAWCRPNPPVGALGDKFRPATSYLTVATKARDRYFDLYAVRVPSAYAGQKASTVTGLRTSQTAEVAPQSHDERTRYEAPATAPPLDYWEIPTESYKGSHYATWPRDLLVRPIKAMCPERVCTVCGEPSRRVHQDNPEYAGRGGTGLTEHNNAQQGASLKGFRHVAYPAPKSVPAGWTDCGHDSWRPGVVLDPFAGSGTTLAVATGHGRDAVGIDIDERNANLASQRVGMFLTVAEFDKVRDGH